MVLRIIFLLSLVWTVNCYSDCEIDESCDKSAMDKFWSAGWKNYPSSWFVGDPCSGQNGKAWSGIVCGGLPPRVINITISGFKGKIPEELSKVYYLQRLELIGAGLSGDLPLELSSLQYMADFTIRMSELNMGLSEDLPYEYSTWTRLQHFEFYCPTYQPFHGNLPAEWSTWTNIRYLEISNCLQQGGKIPSSWGTFSNLEHLDLHSNYLSGFLPSELSTAKNLEYLDISLNLLIHSTLPPQYSTFSNISYIQAQNNKIIGKIPEQFSTWENLEFFSISSNKITGSLSKDFSTWSEISNFRAGTNLLSGTLPVEISSWANISEFWIPFNLFSGTVPMELGHSWDGLRQFDISQNKRICGEVSDSLLQVGGVRSIIGTNIEGWCIGKEQPVSWVLVVVTIIIGFLILFAIMAMTWYLARHSIPRQRQARGTTQPRRTRRQRRSAPDGRGDYEDVPYEPPIVVQPSSQQAAKPTAPTM